MNMVSKVGNSAADALMGEIVDDYLERLSRDEAPEIEEYAQRYPELASVLRQTLPTLQLLRVAGAGPWAGAAPPGSPLCPEAPLGDFRIIREVGRGGMGVVYEAVQISLGRSVALKVLPFASTLDPKQLQRFKNEAQAAAHLHHPNIVPVHATGCERGVHYYAMQFIEGQSLADMLTDQRQGRTAFPGRPAREQPENASRLPATVGQDSNPALQPAGLESCPTKDTPPNARLSTEKSATGKATFRLIATLGIQAAEALDCSHELGVIHRDIKPANMLVDGRGKLWITDFGLAHCQSQTGLTMSGDLVGTLRYMSPEQALAKRVIVDHRTDIYSLGATLYELLTLEPVFAGTDRQELLRQIAFEEPIPPRRHNKSIPAELEIVVQKALEKNPADRYGTAKELAEDLERFVKDEPIKARRPSLGRRLAQACRRHKQLVSTTIAIMVTVLLLSGGSVWWQHHQRAATEEAVAEDLKDADFWQRKEQWSKVLQALERAKIRLERSGLVSLQARVENRQRDVKLIDQLGMARMARMQRLAVAEAPIWEWDYAGADQTYRSAFAEYGLDVTVLGKDQAVRRIADSGIRSYLVNALDDWAFCQDHLPHGDGKLLREIAQSADDDPWRRKLRDPKLRNNESALRALAGEDAVLSQPAECLLLLFALLRDAKAEPDGIRLLKKAQQLHPADFWINFQLAASLGNSWETAAEAVAFCRAALAVQPQSPVVYLILAHTLGHLGFDKRGEAEAACFKAIALQPDFAPAYNNQASWHHWVGYVLGHLGRFSESEASYRRAIQLEPSFAAAHLNLGSSLGKQGKEREAEEAHRKAIQLKPEWAIAYTNLGRDLGAQQKFPEAEEAFRKAVGLEPGNAGFHHNLGLFLLRQNKVAEAEAGFRKAIKLLPRFPEAYEALGLALNGQQKFPEAEAAYRKAIEHKPDDADVYCNLGYVLRYQGKFTDSLAAFKMAHKLSSTEPSQSSRTVREAERFVLLDAKLPNILTREIQPADAAECFELAQLCELPCRQFYAAAVGFYSDAFAADSKLANALEGGRPYSAGCAAALAGCGQGKDAANLKPEEYARLRGQALSWLRADLAQRRLEFEEGLEKRPDRARELILGYMRHWHSNPDLNGVRGSTALARLPKAERQEWQKLWQEVEELERRASPPK